MKRYFSKNLNRIDVQEATSFTHDIGNFPHRLQRPGLIIGGPKGGQRGRTVSQYFAEMIEVHNARFVDAEDLDRLRRKSTARKYRGMFDGRNHQPVDWQSRITPEPRCQRKPIRLGAARRENDVAGVRAD